MNEHEKFIREMGLNDNSTLGDYLDTLKNFQEDVAINLLGHLLDLSKIKGKSEDTIISKCANCELILVDDGKKGIDEKIYCPKCYNTVIQENLEFLSKLEKYCEDMHYKVGASILDDFKNIITQQIKKLRLLEVTKK